MFFGPWQSAPLAIFFVHLHDPVSQLFCIECVRPQLAVTFIFFHKPVVRLWATPTLGTPLYRYSAFIAFKLTHRQRVQKEFGWTNFAFATPSRFSYLSQSSFPSCNFCSCFFTFFSCFLNNVSLLTFNGRFACSIYLFNAFKPWRDMSPHRELAATSHAESFTFIFV